MSGALLCANSKKCSGIGFHALLFQAWVKMFFGSLEPQSKNQSKVEGAGNGSTMFQMKNSSTEASQPSPTALEKKCPQERCQRANALSHEHQAKLRADLAEEKMATERKKQKQVTTGHWLTTSAAKS
jgi:hypothetical protein